jgi:hypothetical protein
MSWPFASETGGCRVVSLGLTFDRAGRVWWGFCLRAWPSVKHTRVQGAGGFRLEGVDARLSSGAA